MEETKKYIILRRPEFSGPSVADGIALAQATPGVEIIDTIRHDERNDCQLLVNAGNEALSALQQKLTGWSILPETFKPLPRQPRPEIRREP